MLILTRRKNEEILINNGEIIVKILSVDRGNVMLGLQAPRGINILRKEVYLRQQAQMCEISHEN